jgi:hypothetical protein
MCVAGGGLERYLFGSASVPIAHLCKRAAASFFLGQVGQDVSLGGHKILPSRTILRVIGDWVNSNSTTRSFRLISRDFRLLKRNSPDLILVAARGDFGLAVRMDFLGGLGPKGEIGSGSRECWGGLQGLDGPVGATSSNSGPREKDGASDWLKPCSSSGDGEAVI